MALVLADRVKETSTTTGTGSFTLAGATTGFQSFNSAIGNGNTTYYTIENMSAGEWETGLGTFTSPATLARTTVYASSNAGSAVNFSAGTKSVYVDMSATKFPAGVLGTANGGTGTTTSTGSGANVLATSPALVTPDLGTPSAVTLTNATGLPIGAGTTGTLAVNRGGTGQTSYTNGQLLIGGNTGNTLTKATLTAGSGVTITNGDGSITISSAAGGSGGATASGSVTLTSSSSGAQSITTTDYGQYVKLPDATTMTKAANNFNVKNAGSFPLKILDNSGNILGFIMPNDSSMIGCADSSTAAGVWTCTNTELIAVTGRLSSTTLATQGILRKVALDTDRTFLMWCNNTALYGVVYTASTSTWGTPTTIRASAASCQAILVSTDKILVTSCTSNATAFEAVVLTFSGSTITVNTAATKTLAANMTYNNMYNLIVAGTTYVCCYRLSTPVNNMLAMTISGTTVTIGAEVSMAGTGDTYFDVVTVSSTVVMSFSYTASTAWYAEPWSISGTTLTLGTKLTLSSANVSQLRIASISSGTRWVVMYVNNAGTHCAATIVSVSGTTATGSSVNVTAGANQPVGSGFIVTSGSKALYCDFSGGTANLITDTAGTASAGTAITINTNRGIATSVSASSIRVMCPASTAMSNITFDISGSSPVVSKFYTYGNTTAISCFMGTNAPFNSSCTRYYGIVYGSNYAICFDGVDSSGANMRLAVATSDYTYALPSRFMPGNYIFGGNSGVNTPLGANTNEVWGMLSGISIGGLGALIRVECVS